MASSSDKQYVMGYPSMNNMYSQPPPSPGYAMPCQPGAYPPPMQPPYNGYPGMPESKKYFTPSFNVWYNSREYGPMGWEPEEDNSSSKGFGRLMLVTMVTLITSMCMVSLVIWFLFGTQVPEFHVASLSVSNFDMNDSMIAAKWDVNVTVFNSNRDLKVEFIPIKASVFYKNVPLALSAIEPFHLQGAHLHEFQIKMDNGKAIISKPLMAEEINSGHSSGHLFVSVRLSLGAKFSTNSIWRKETLRVFCENLILNFASKGGNGTLAEDGQTECLIFT
ncbi:hypothetical protein ACH5RR_005681 [Cinchona calisaya]|uniref:Late embryogenesis abundant protein LEA-2 subgroup domain-containing protein n=1 Tax=Cinchona calisaya TaxID=153742 RepID=A0ABD3ALT5_9GENT